MSNKKSSIVYSLVIILTILVSACSASASTTAAASDANNGASAPADGQAMPPEGAPEGMPAGSAPEGTPGAMPPAGQAPADQAPAAEATSTAVATATIAPTATPDEESTEEISDLNINAVLSVAKKTFNKTDEDIVSTEDDTSAALITGGGNLTIGNISVTTSGDTSSVNNSARYGQNAAILSKEVSALKVLYGGVTTSGKGATGVFATKEGSTATVLEETIATSGDYARGVMVTELASMTVTDSDITTSGYKSPAIATGVEGGSISVEGGSATTSGTNSAAVYSTGEINVSGTTLAAEASPAAALEGAGSISLTNVDATSGVNDGGTVQFYPSSSDKVESGVGSFSMEGGSLTTTGSNGALFYIADAEGKAELKSVDTSTASGTLIQAVALTSDKYSTGGVLTVSAEGQILTGNVVADAASSVTLNLSDSSSLTGAVSPTNEGRVVNISLDESSTWTVTADSYLTKLDDQDGISDSDVTNIIGNGYTVYYNKNANVYLRGRIYNLSGGGYLKPLN
jgi:hypothetical protein